ncbi:ANTAR domain-containing protein [Nocardia sp. ET3-3]|uniref:ANTAR domain-containing protein n=1 Tax=Nocardia terrae TaxID=2675851 RepID=A0A7K1UWM0_9NOCA|nr:GAF and ANTAR domain-containing protein [Nocardia terrae]MVU78780.1 ANTAR domain-containing protein [Nocardia terrae]
MTAGLPEGLTTLTAALLSPDAGAGARELPAIISGMLVGEPGVCLVLEVSGLGCDGVQGISGERVRLDDVVSLCRETIETGRPLSVPDLRAPTSRARHPEARSAHGIGSFEGRPLLADQRVVGALGLCSPRAHAFGEDLRQRSALIADHLGVLLGVVAERAKQITVAGQLHAALSSRAVIDQALGIVMARRRCDRDVAFDTLRRLSNRRNVKVHELAAEIIAALDDEVTEYRSNGPDPRRDVNLT